MSTKSLVLFASILLPAPAAANLILNGSFESPVLTVGFCIVPTTCPVSAANWSGVYQWGIASGNPFDPPTPFPDGTQALIFQSAGNNISQVVNLPVTGEYLLTWFDAGRDPGAGFGGNEPYEIRLDGIALGLFSTTTSQPWTQHSLVFTSSAGPHTLSIVSPGPVSGDQTAFLDNFVLTAQPGAIPEPGTAATLTLGLVALLLLRRRGR